MSALKMARRQLLKEFGDAGALLQREARDASGSSWFSSIMFWMGSLIVAAVIAFAINTRIRWS
jgi:hypothetical protein